MKAWENPIVECSGDKRPTSMDNMHCRKCQIMRMEGEISHECPCYGRPNRCGVWSDIYAGWFFQPEYKEIREKFLADMAIDAKNIEVLHKNRVLEEMARAWKRGEGYQLAGICGVMFHYDGHALPADEVKQAAWGLID